MLDTFSELSECTDDVMRAWLHNHSFKFTAGWNLLHPNRIPATFSAHTLS